MTQKLPPLVALKSFVSAARHLNLTHAGKELCVTHSAVWRQIRNLEEWFGAALFRREGRGLKLTQPGQALFDAILPLFTELADACQRIRNNVTGSSLTIGCIPSIASRWLIPRIDRFSQRHPDVDIQVVYARAHERLAESTLDILITFGADDSPGIVARHVFPRTNKPVCSPHFLKSHGPFDTPEKIANANRLHDEFRDDWKEWFRLAGVSSGNSHAGPLYQDFNLLATALIAGHGIGLCPVTVFEEEIKNGFLVVLSDIATHQDKSYYLLTREDHTRLVDDFVEWFFEDVIRPPQD